MLWEAEKCTHASRCINFEPTYFVRWQRQIIGLFTPVYTLKALIANLLAVKGLTGLRPRLRAHVKGLIIIIGLICNLLRSPQSHLYQNIMILSAVAKTKLSNYENGKWIYWWGTRPQTGLFIYIFQAVLSRTIYDILLCSTQVAWSWMSNILDATWVGDAMGCYIYPCPSSSVAIPTTTWPLHLMYLSSKSISTAPPLGHSSSSTSPAQFWLSVDLHRKQLRRTLI